MLFFKCWSQCHTLAPFLFKDQCMCWCMCVWLMERVLCNRERRHDGQALHSNWKPREHWVSHTTFLSGRISIAYSSPPTQNPLDENAWSPSPLMGFEKEARRENAGSMQLRFSQGLATKVMYSDQIETLRVELTWLFYLMGNTFLSASRRPQLDHNHHHQINVELPPQQSLLDTIQYLVFANGETHCV